MRDKAERGVCQALHDYLIPLAGLIVAAEQECEEAAAEVVDDIIYKSGCAPLIDWHEEAETPSPTTPPTSTPTIESTTAPTPTPTSSPEVEFLETATPTASVSQTEMDTSYSPSNPHVDSSSVSSSSYWGPMGFN